MGNTFPYVPDRITTSSPEFKTTIVTFEDGNEQRLANWSQHKTTFALRFQYLPVEKLTNPQGTGLVDFFISKRGAWAKFYFQNHIDGRTYTVRFKSDSLRIDYVNAKIANVDLELVVC